MVDFAQDAPPPAHAWQGRGLAELIAAALDDADRTAAPRGKVRKAEELLGPKRMRRLNAADAAEIGRLTLARLVLVGRLSIRQERVAVRCSLIRSADRKRLARRSFDAADLFAAARLVLNVVGEHVSAATDARLATRDSDALRFYCAALGQSSEQERAKLLERAAEGDATFAAALEALGRAYVRLNELSKAEGAFIRLGELPGSAERARLFQGAVCEKRGRIQDAQRLYRRIPDGSRLAARARYRLGRLAEKHGDIESARTAYGAALAGDPFCASAANSLGVLHRRQDDFDQAADCFRRAIAADPLWAAPHYNLAVLLDNLGDLRTAADHLRRAVELAPGDPHCRQRLAMMLAGQWRYDAAILHARKAVALAPNDADIVQTLGAVYYHAGKTDDARRELHRSLELNPKLARAHYTIGLTRQLDRNPEAAAASYRRALQLDPTLADCRAALERCEAMIHAQRQRERQSFACASTGAGPGDPAGPAAALLICAVPAIWWRILALTSHRWVFRGASRGANDFADRPRVPRSSGAWACPA